MKVMCLQLMKETFFLMFTAVATHQGMDMIRVFLKWPSYFRIVCTDFAGKYGKADSEFDCFYSSVDQNIVITHLDQQEESYNQSKRSWSFRNFSHKSLKFLPQPHFECIFGESISSPVSTSLCFMLFFVSINL